MRHDFDTVLKSLDSHLSSIAAPSQYSDQEKFEKVCNDYEEII